MSESTAAVAFDESPKPDFSLLFRCDLHLDIEADAQPAPDCFVDLNLDQLVASVVRGRETYDLQGYFHVPLDDVADVGYRQAVFRDLEDEAIEGCLTEFGHGMRTTRTQLGAAAGRHYPVEQQRGLLAAARTYTHAVSALRRTTSGLHVQSEALQRLAAGLDRYASCEAYTRLESDVEQVLRMLDSLSYRLRINGDTLQVSALEGDAPDYATELAETFSRFRQRPAQSHLSRVDTSPDMDHVEAQIAAFVARLHPQPFAALDEFANQHRHFIDPGIARADREIQFYLAYRELMSSVGRRGLPFCCPELTRQREKESAAAAYDLALADALPPETTVVTNDFQLDAEERVIVVTGPNQGGKTTFARLFGQLHYLASLGVPVPADSATVMLADRVATLFERGENLLDLQGHLKDDLLRARSTLAAATERSVVILNEIFTSTSLLDATFLSERLMEEVDRHGSTCLFVTFMDQLATGSRSSVSYVADVDRDNEDLPTYKVVRRPADGLAYAKAVALRYRLNEACIVERIGG